MPYSCWLLVRFPHSFFVFRFTTFCGALRLAKKRPSRGATWSYFFINTLQSFRILLLACCCAADACVITTFTLPPDASASDAAPSSASCSSFSTSSARSPPLPFSICHYTHIIYGATIYFYLAFHCCGCHLHALVPQPPTPPPQQFVWHLWTPHSAAQRLSL